MKRRTLHNLIFALSLLSLLVFVMDCCNIFNRLAAIYSLKSQMGTITGQTDGALHAYFGIAIFAIVAILYRKPFHHMMPWSFVWVVELFNEFIDIQNSYPVFGDRFWFNCLSDIIYTVTIPTAILMLAKFRQYSSRSAVGLVAKNKGNQGSRCHEV